MTITNKLNLPYGLERAVSPLRHNAPGCLSATTLLKGLKQIILEERHWDALTDDVSERIWAVFGSAVHALLEQEGEYDFTEQQLSRCLGGVTIVGRIDNYDMLHGIVCDYKTASVWKVKFRDFSDWYRQGMIYAWLLVQNGFKAERCRFIALLKDHSKMEALRAATYPQNPVYIYEFDVTRDALERTEAFLLAKVQAYHEYSELADALIPVCSAEERWERPRKYAVKKSGRRTAVRVLDTRAEAETLAVLLSAQHYVEERVGESVRCRAYCLCRQFCEFAQEEPDPRPGKEE